MAGVPANATADLMARTGARIAVSASNSPGMSASILWGDLGRWAVDSLDAGASSLLRARIEALVTSL